MEKIHLYKTSVRWTGNRGEGTRDYRGYGRDHEISVTGKTTINASSDAAFLGDPSRHNPEELFLASLSSCHMLWYLHLCAVNGVVVADYRDEATGTMVEEKDGGGHFTEVMLHPKVTITDRGKIDLANSLHEAAHKKCFIASSCNFPVKQQPSCTSIN